MLEFTLPDMTCGHCVATVKRTLEALDPAAKVEIDLPSRLVKVDTSVDEERVRVTLVDEGYPPASK